MPPMLVVKRYNEMEVISTNAEQDNALIVLNLLEGLHSANGRKIFKNTLYKQIEQGNNIGMSSLFGINAVSDVVGIFCDIKPHLNVSPTVVNIHLLI